jgi:hypothetical protein
MRVFRPAFVAAVWIVFGFTTGISSVNHRFAEIYAPLQMKELPVSTELVLAASGFFSRGAGAALLGILAAFASTLALQGRLDRWLPVLTFALLLAALLYAAVSILGVYLPLVKIQQVLSR